ncbi:MAG: ABC transporter permease, partial [Firmicutes bacterium]|nr:ABC transporter permease [Bacillota bacterium]
RINPLLAKEMRLQMRSWRTFAMVAFYLVVLGGFGTIFFSSMSGGLRMGNMDSAQLGQSMFIFLSLLQFALIVLFVPGLTANAISGEKERQTFDLLVSTQLTSLGIVLGKLTASLSTVFLLIFSSLPLYGFVFLLGGVAPRELAILVIILMLTALLFGSVTLLFSALFRKTTLSFIAAYGLAGFILGGTLMLNALNTALFYRGAALPLHYLLVINPLVLFEWLYPEALVSLFSQLSQNTYPFRTLSWLHFWHLNIIANALIAAVSLGWAARLVNPLRASRKK